MTDSGFGEGGEVIGRDGSGDFISIDGMNLQSCSGECQRICPNSTSQVGHACEPCANITTRMKSSNGEARGLLEPCFGEEHASGEVPELRYSFATQFGLGEHRGH